MKIIIDKNQLIYKLQELSLVVRDNSIRPAISGVKLEAKNNKIKFTGTTLETTIKTSIDGDILEDGVVVFKIELVLEYIKLLYQEKIEIYADSNKLFIHNAEISTLNSEEYSKLPNLEGELILETESNILVEAFDKVLFSASRSPDNLAISTIRMKLEDNKMLLITTDSYRLTYYSINCENILNREISISLENAIILSKLFREKKEILKIFIDGNKLKIATNNLIFSTRLVDLEYPNYQSILSGISSNKTIELNLTDFKSAIKKIITIAKRNIETKNGAFFDFIGNKLNIRASSGTAKTVQKIDTIKNGDDFKASLNIKYIEDFLKHIEKNIVIQASKSDSMFILKESGNDNYIYILMPLSLRD